MKITYAHLCDYAMVTQDGKVSAIGIFHNIGCLVFPAMHPVAALAFEIDLIPAEVGRELRIAIQLTNQDGRMLGKMEGRMVPKGTVPGGEVLHIPQAILLAGLLRFERAGTYSFDIFVNDHLEYQLPFGVTQATPPAQIA